MIGLCLCDVMIPLLHVRMRTRPYMIFGVCLAWSHDRVCRLDTPDRTPDELPSDAMAFQHLDRSLVA
jgi:hypothetical protein